MHWLFVSLVTLDRRLEDVAGNFLPRSRSKIIFLLVMTCYAFTLNTVATRLIRLIACWPMLARPIERGLPRLPPWANDFSYLIDALLIAPITESLIMIGVIECLRRLQFGVSMQLIASTGLICLIHSMRYLLWGVLAAPVFMIDAGTFIYWRRISFRTGTGMMIALHSLFNGIGALSFVSRHLLRVP
jgi:hypothetical protein